MTEPFAELAPLHFLRMKFPSQGCGWRAARWEFMQTDEWMVMRYDPDTPLFDLAMHEIEENGLRKTKQFQEFHS